MKKSKKTIKPKKGPIILVSVLGASVLVLSGTLIYQNVAPKRYTIDFQGENCFTKLDKTNTYKSGDVVTFSIFINDPFKYNAPLKIDTVGLNKTPAIYEPTTGAVKFTIEESDVVVIAKAETIATHTIFFSLNGAPDTPIAPVSVTHETTIPKEYIPDDPIYPGHPFEGWSLNEKTKNIIDLTTATFSLDTTLYAWWGDVELVNITFDANGGYFDNLTYVTSKIIPTDYGQVPYSPIPSRNSDIEYNYTFIGWNKNIETAKPISEGGTCYYEARWRPTKNTYRITFDANGGEVSIPFIDEIKYGSRVDILNCPVATREGYEDSTDWYDAPIGGKKFIFNDNASPIKGDKVEGNITLYTHWDSIKTYEVRFDANGGIYPENNEDLIIRSGVEFNTMPAIPEPPIKIDPSCIKSYVFIGYDKIVTPVSGDDETITYIAMWSEIHEVFDVNVYVDTDAKGSKFPDGETVKTLVLPSGANIVQALSTLPTPIYGIDEELRHFDRYVYQNGNEIGINDILTSTTKIIAKYRNKTLDECSWNEIKGVSDKGADYAEFLFGSLLDFAPDGTIHRNSIEKTIMINNQPHTVRILGYGEDYTNLNDKENTAIGISFEFTTFISDDHGYSLGTYWNDIVKIEEASFDYMNSSIRKALNNVGDGELHWFSASQRSIYSTFYVTPVIDMLPSDLVSVLSTPSKYINIYNKTKKLWEEKTVEDKLFLLSPKEMGCTTESVNNYEEPSTTNYKYYYKPLFHEVKKSQVLKYDGLDVYRDNTYSTNGKYKGYVQGSRYICTVQSTVGCNSYFRGYHWLRSPSIREHNPSGFGFDPPIYYYSDVWYATGVSDYEYWFQDGFDDWNQDSANTNIFPIAPCFCI